MGGGALQQLCRPPVPVAVTTNSAAGAAVIVPDGDVEVKRSALASAPMVIGAREVGAIGQPESCG